MTHSSATDIRLVKKSPWKRYDCFVPLSSFPQLVRSCSRDYQDATHEFKRSLHSADMLKNVMAFLNAAGGTLYCGIDDDGVVCGLHLPRKQRDDLRLLVRLCVNVFNHHSPCSPPAVALS